MGLEDFLFNRTATTWDLRAIEERQRAARRRARRGRRGRVRNSKRIEDLEDELGYVTLVLGAAADLDLEGVVPGFEDLEDPALAAVAGAASGALASGAHASHNVARVPTDTMRSVNISLASMARRSEMSRTSAITCCSSPSVTRLTRSSSGKVLSSLRV